MSAQSEKQRLMGLINLHLLSAPWTSDEQRSAIYEGIVFVVTPQTNGSGVEVTASIHVPADQYGADPLSGIRMQASLPGQFGSGVMDRVAGSSTTYRIVFQMDRVAAVKYELF